MQEKKKDQRYELFNNICFPLHLDELQIFLITLINCMAQEENQTTEFYARRQNTGLIRYSYVNVRASHSIVLKWK